MKIVVNKEENVLSFRNYQTGKPKMSMGTRRFGEFGHLPVYNNTFVLTIEA